MTEEQSSTYQMEERIRERFLEAWNNRRKELERKLLHQMFHQLAEDEEDMDVLPLVQKNAQGIIRLDANTSLDNITRSKTNNRARLSGILPPVHVP